MTLARVLAALVAALTLGGLAIAFTAANSVQQSNAGTWSTATGANELKPAACNWTLTTVVSGNAGTAGNDLILGSGAGETITGGGGQDCILAGAGNDTITGNSHKSGSTPVFAGDYCDGGAGVDTVTTFKAGPTTYPTCDTQANVP